MGPQTDATSKAILIVDDEPGVLRACARMVQAAGYEVLTAGTGREALAVCDDHPGSVSLALIDLVMPEMTGPELAERLRAAYRGVKIVFMSGYSTDEIGELGVMDPAAHFLGKPFSAEMLRQKVRDVLEGRG